MNLFGTQRRGETVVVGEQHIASVLLCDAYLTFTISHLVFQIGKKYNK